MKKKLSRGNIGAALIKAQSPAVRSIQTQRGVLAPNTVLTPALLGRLRKTAAVGLIKGLGTGGSAKPLPAATVARLRKATTLGPGGGLAKLGKASLIGSRRGGRITLKMHERPWERLKWPSGSPFSGEPRESPAWVNVAR